METPSPASAMDNEKDEMVQDLVQIKATDEDEVQRRIDAFIKNKRSEMDEQNIREFISPFSPDIGNSCARVEAIYVHREGQKSHITLKQVENAYGPQTQHSADEYSRSQQNRLPLDEQRKEAVEERLSNMEDHLHIASGGADLYQRIKHLEERIMFLEGLSPEYFNNNNISQSKSSSESRDEQEDRKVSLLPSQNETLPDINRRIEQLKRMLKSKAENLY